MKKHSKSVFSNSLLTSLLLICIPILFSFDAKKPYVIKVEDELIRFIANNEDHSSLNFTNLEEGTIYILEYNRLPKMPEVHLEDYNVTIIDSKSNFLQFIAQKNNIFSFKWDSQQNLREFSVNVYPAEKVFNEKIVSKSQALISVDASVPVVDLVDSLISGDCFQVFNITGNAGSNGSGAGTFANGSTSIGINSGIVLSNGDVPNVIGPNNSCLQSGVLGSGSDPDLTQIAGVTVNDASIIEFDFIPTVDTVQFKFVWASEEYCNYSGSAFTDVCGFFVSGDGINGSYSNNSQNFAKSPFDPPNSSGGNINVNLFSHYNHSPAYYISNNISVCNTGGNCQGPPAHPLGTAPGVNEFELNAHSAVFDAIIPVTPCSTYHIKIAVGDGTDGIGDSAFFLQGNSWNQGNAVTVEAINSDDGSNQGFETCDTYYYEFCKDPASDINEEVTMDFVVSPNSTATAGADYEAFPTSVVIPAGIQCVQVPIETLEDDIAEGQESIILEVDDACNCSSSEVIFLINDVIPLESSIADEEICGPGTIDLLANPTGGLTPYQYSWSTGGIGQTETVNSSDSPIFVTITDNCGEEFVDQVIINELTVPDATISGSGSLCPGSGATLDLTVAFSDAGPWEFTYFDGSAATTITTSNNPYTITISDPGSYTLQDVTNTANNCAGTVNGIAVITTGSLTLTSSEINPLCFNSSDGSISITTSGGSGNYNYSWSHDPSINTNSASGLSSGTYTIDVSDGSSSCAGSISITLDNPAEVTSSLGSAPLIDCNNPSGTISVTPTGGTGSYFYIWTTSNGNIVSGNNASTVTVDAGGDYTVSVEDTNGCAVSNSITVAQDTIQPNVVVVPAANIDCTNTTATLDGTGSDSGTILWTTSDGNIVSGGATLQPVVNQAGTYTLTITDLTNGCSNSADVVVTSNGDLPIAVIGTPGQIDCNNSTIVIDATGSSSGANITYLWTTADGNITAGSTTLNPTVDQGGTYILTIIDSSNGCEADNSVTIVEDTVNPAADVGNQNQIDCNNTTLTLGGPGTSTGSGITYLWTASNGGVIVSGANTVNPVVNAAGTYTFTVTDSNNGCIDIQAIDVTENLNDPTAVATGGGVIDCNNSTTILSGAGSSIGLSYSWSASNGGNIVSGGSSIDAVVNAAGTYTLTVTDPANGCSSVSPDVFVTEDTALPTADAGPTVEITCSSSTVTLDGTGSSSGLNYLWTTTTGNIVSGETTLTPIVDQAGTYVLTVTNNANGCSETSNVTVTSNANLPIISINTPGDITCTTTTLVLDGSGSSGGDVYLWTTSDGSIVSGANTTNPTVDAGGTYTLTITDVASGCQSSSNVVVTEETNLPSVAINAAGQITCTTSVVTLDGSGSSGGDNYLWTTSDGNIVSGADTANPVVDAVGTYTLTVTNVGSGCSNTANIVVSEDVTLPTAVATAGGNIDCNTTEIALNGGGSDTPPNFDILWTTANGNILFGENTLTPVVDAAGTYTLEVTSLSNGCVTNASVDVTEDLIAPLADAGSDMDLTCTTTEVVLDGTNSEQGPGFVYTWSTGDGNIVSGGSTLTPTVDAAGTYTLSITSDINGCTGTADVLVNQDASVPTADAGPPQTIDCTNNTVILDGSMSSTGLQYQWTTVNGNIVSGSTSLNPLVDAGGTYVLEVTNIGNGCTATSSVDVAESTNQPSASVAIPSSIDCDFPTVTLDGSASSSGPTITYQWTTANGNIVSGANTANPVVDLSGLYTLTVTDNSSLCAASVDVSVFGDATAPVAVATASDNWDCASTTILLDGNGSSTGANIAYQWSTSNGNIITDPFSVVATADTSGIYILSVLNNSNNCLTTVTVDVLNLVNYPSITINDPGPINCSNPEVDITTTITNEGTNPTYNWTTTNGNIVTGASNSTVTVDAAGTYEITVINSFNSCESTESIDITENSVYPTALAGPTGELTCTDPTYTLDGTGTSTGTNYLYQWTTADGNIVSDATTLMPVVDLEGSYILSVTDTSSLCESLDTVAITSNQSLPNVEAGASQELNCTATDVTLAGSTTSTGPDFSYQWTTTNGNIVSDATTLTPLVDASGSYLLSITDLINGCIATDSVEVTVDANTPNADAGPGMVIDCSVSSITLDGSSSSSGTDFTYFWTTVDGNIVSGETTTTPVVDAGGTYSIEVTSTVNGCAFTSNVNVLTDTIIPDVDASFIGIVDCNTPTLTLSGAGSSAGVDFTYDWSTNDGTIDSGANTLDPVVSQGGTYTLTVLDTTNTCTDNISITVPENTVIPLSDAGDTLTITCTVPSVVLMGDNSEIGTDIVYQWTTVSGNIVSGATTLNPEVDGGGSYVLTVSNTGNGCESTDSTLVNLDANLPTADAGSSLVIDCANPIIQLDGSGSSSGTSIEYLWTTSNGNIVSGETSTSPTIDAGGTYSIQVSDSSNGCVINSSVDVTDNTQLPTATAGSAGIVDCSTPTVTISGAGSSTGTEFTYLWTTADGTIDSGANTLDPVVSQGGTYTLTILDTISNCEQITDIIIPEDTVIPISEAGDSMIITCVVPEVTLDGSSSENGTGIEYLWTTPTGNIVSGDSTNTLVVDASGVYLLTVSNTINGCISQDSAIVSLDANVPTADAGSDLILDCDNPTTQLDGNGSSGGATIEYIWTTSNGNIVSGETSLTPTVDAGGTYSLQVTDTSNGCVINSDVSVTDDTDIPVATADFNGIVDCTTPTVSISGTGSSTGSEYTYTWTTTNGTIDSGEDSLDPIVSQGGVYTLLILDTLSNCQQTTSVTVPENSVIPTVDVGPDAGLDCATPTMTVDGSNSSSGSDFSYLWTTVDGNIIGDNTGTMIDIDSGGTYLLTVANTVNGCLDSAAVLITQDFTLPQVSTDPGGQINCVDLTIPLIGQTSGNTTNFIYNWQFFGNGSVSAGQGTLNAVASQADMYFLVVTDTVNNCTAIDSVLVTVDSNVPEIIIADLDTLDCALNSLTIDATGSTQDADIIFTWQTTNGQFDSGTNTLTPIVSTAGTYELILNDTVNNCVTNSVFNIEQDTLAPDIILNSSSLINCFDPIIPVDATVNASGAVNALWTATAGGVIEGTNTGLSVNVSSAGTYEVLISDQSNGCASTETINVLSDLDAPVLSAITPDSISCPQPAVTLSASVDAQGDPFTFTWSTNASGSIDSDANTLAPTVSGAAPYTLSVLNDINGCEDSLTVDVLGDLNLPTATAQATGSLDCNILLVDIDGLGSSSGGTFGYTWSTPTGNIVSGQNSLLVQVDQPGDYSLIVENLSNECLDTTTVSVTQDIVAPGVTLNSTSLIDCFNPTIPVDATVNASGTVDALWTATAGGVIEGANTGLSVNVSSAGTYEVLVSDQSNGCTSTETVNVTADLDTPILSALTPASISCPQPAVTLSASVDAQGDPFTFTWSTNASGSIDSDANTLAPTVSGAAPYILSVLNDINGCEDSLTVDVLGDLNLPTATAQATGSLDCNILLVDIDGLGSSSGGTFGYTWSTPTGNIVSGQNSLLVQVDQPGDYSLIVEDLSNECLDTTIVSVTQDIVTPNITLNSTSLVDCFNPTISVDATVNSSGLVNVDWTATAGGTIAGSNTGLSVDVSSAGTYEVLVSDQSNGCTNTETIDVTEDLDKPIISALEPDSISCPQPSVTLSAAVDAQGNPFTITWATNSGGSLDSDTNTLNPTVSGAAPYTLSVQNDLNGCIDSLVIDVFGNLNLPTADAQVADFLSCSNLLIDIDGAGSSSTGNFTYTWSTTNGNIVTGQNTLMVQVDQPGDYLLQVEDLSNSCVQTTSVTVNQDLTAPVSSVAMPDTIDCGTFEVDLLGDVGPNPAPTYVYTWSTTNGNISSGTNVLNAIADQVGTYTLQVLDSFNGCSATSTVEVTQDVIAPNADAGFAQILDCNLTEQALDGSASSLGAEFAYLWTTVDGNIVNQQNTLNPTVDAPGTYDLLVTNTQNACTNLAQVIVDEQVVPPIVEAGQNDTINCIQSTAQLSGLGSSTGIDYEYLWSSLDGNPITVQDQLDINVALEGVYQLLVTNNINGCKDSDLVFITLDTITPVLSTQIPDILNCTVSEALLSVNSSVIDNVTYSWTTTTGNIVSGANTSNPIVDAPGSYVLQFVNDINGCQAQDQIDVVQDVVVPSVDAGAGGTITCIDIVFTAQGSVTTNSGQSIISWNSSNGTIDSGANTANPVVSSAGTYIIEVIDIINDCVSSDTVEVLLDQDIPVISSLSPQTLDCNNPTVTIDGSATALEPQFVIQWTTANGNIVGGNTTLSPIVDLEGQYVLNITDSDNGCENTSSVDISSDFEFPDISAGLDIDLPCGVSTTNLEGSIVGAATDLQILWSALNGNILSGSTTLTPTIDIGGTYSLSVQNTLNGCASLDTVMVLFDAPPTLSLQTVDPECAGYFGSLNITEVLGGTPPYVYSIDNGQNFSSSADFGFLNIGDYQVVAQDFNGCETDVTAVSLTEPPVFDVLVLDTIIAYTEGQQGQIIADPSYPLSSISSIVWSPPFGLSCIDCLDPVVNTQTSTTYFLELISASGCEAGATVTVLVDKSAKVFIANTFTPNSDGVNEVLMIQADVTNINQVKRFDIYDRWGELIFSQTNFQPNDPQYGWDGTLNGSILNQGVYIYAVEVEMLDGRIELFKGDVFLGN